MVFTGGDFVVHRERKVVFTGRDFVVHREGGFTGGEFVVHRYGVVFTEGRLCCSLGGVVFSGGTLLFTWMGRWCSLGETLLFTGMGRWCSLPPQACCSCGDCGQTRAAPTAVQQTTASAPQPSAAWMLCFSVSLRSD